MPSPSTSHVVMWNVSHYRGANKTILPMVQAPNSRWYHTSLYSLQCYFRLSNNGGKWVPKGDPVLAIA